jgi:hypothetical protein
MVYDGTMPVPPDGPAARKMARRSVQDSGEPSPHPE